MPRKPVSVRDRRATTITPNQVEFLIRGWTYFPPREPFEDDAETQAAWEQYKDEVMSLRDADHESRPSPGAYFKSGTRPWAFWRFEQGQDPPFSQAGLLDDLDQLEPGERETAIELARVQWLGSPPGSSRRDPVSDEALLAAWPRFPEEDE